MDIDMNIEFPFVANDCDRYVNGQIAYMEMIAKEHRKHVQLNIFDND